MDLERAAEYALIRHFHRENGRLSRLSACWLLYLTSRVQRVLIVSENEPFLPIPNRREAVGLDRLWVLGMLHHLSQQVKELPFIPNVRLGMVCIDMRNQRADQHPLQRSAR